MHESHYTCCEDGMLSQQPPTDRSGLCPACRPMTAPTYRNVLCKLVAALDQPFRYPGEIEAALKPARALLAAGVTASQPTEQWRPMKTAPTDGTIVRLLVDYRGEDACHPLEDAEVTHTIGGNTDGHTGLSEGWKFAGWSWEQDCFTEGRGKPIGWLPLAPSGVSASEGQTK